MLLKRMVKKKLPMRIIKLKKTYQVKIRTYMINEESGEKNYSDFTDIVTIKTKSMKFSRWIKSLFVKMY